MCGELTACGTIHKICARYHRNIIMKELTRAQILMNGQTLCPFFLLHARSTIKKYKKRRKLMDRAM